MNLLPKSDKSREAPTPRSTPEPGFAKKLKPTVSLGVLEEKTSLFVQGKSSGKAFAGVLKAAFGDKIDSVKDEILANLPKSKADELAKEL